MLPSFFRGTVTRIRPGITYARGSELPDWDNVALLVIPGCSIQPGITNLSQEGRVLGISDGYTAYLPAGSDVKAGDRIVFKGEAYTIIGEPRPWTSPSGNISNIQLALQRWSG